MKTAVAKPKVVNPCQDHKGFDKKNNAIVCGKEGDFRITVPDGTTHTWCAEDLDAYLNQLAAIGIGWDKTISTLSTNWKVECLTGKPSPFAIAAEPMTEVQYLRDAMERARSLLILNPTRSPNTDPDGAYDILTEALKAEALK